LTEVDICVHNFFVVLDLLQSGEPPVNEFSNALAVLADKIPSLDANQLIIIVALLVIREVVKSQKKG
jgi:hypothetical protein